MNAAKFPGFSQLLRKEQGNKKKNTSLIHQIGPN